MNDFLPSNYEIPTTTSRYTKLDFGNTKIRILSKPLVGWEWWVKEGSNRSPKRVETQDEVPAKFMGDKVGRDKAREFWAMIVWNYTDKAVQIWEVRQTGIKKAILTLSNNTDWGNPLKYDLVVSKKKTGSEPRDVEYSVIPTPKKPLSKEIKEASKEKIDLTMLLSGGNPFEEKEKKEEDDFSDINDDGSDLPF